MPMNDLKMPVPTIMREGDRIVLQGPVTIDHVVRLTRQGVALFGNQSLMVDLEGVTDVDSTIISMLLEWQRAAQKTKRSLQFIHMSESLKSLIQLYGVMELFPVSRDHASEFGAA